MIDVVNLAILKLENSQQHKLKVKKLITSLKLTLMVVAALLILIYEENNLKGMWERENEWVDVIKTFADIEISAILGSQSDHR